MGDEPALYQIRVSGHLGPILLTAFPAFVPERQGAETVLTGLLPSTRSALRRPRRGRGPGPRPPRRPQGRPQLIKTRGPPERAARGEGRSYLGIRASGRYVLLPCGQSTGRRDGWAASESSRPCVLASKPSDAARERVIWVEGEPGIGKSSLVAEALAAGERSELGHRVGDRGAADQAAAAARDAGLPPGPAGFARSEASPGRGPAPQLPAGAVRGRRRVGGGVEVLVSARGRAVRGRPDGDGGRRPAVGR